MSTGYDYSWFILTQSIIKKEFALSGSEQNPDLTGKSWRMTIKRATNKGAPAPVEAFKKNGADFIVRDNLADLVSAMNALAGDNLLKLDHIKAQIEARDREMSNPYVKDAQVMNIHNARRYIGDRLIRTAKPHRILDPEHGPLIAVKLNILTRKTLGGFETDLDSRVFGRTARSSRGFTRPAKPPASAAAACTAIARWRARFWAAACFRGGMRDGRRRRRWGDAAVPDIHASCPIAQQECRREPGKTYMAGTCPAITSASQTWKPATVRSRRPRGVLLRLDPPRQHPAEIGQRRVGADREQLIVRIGVEHFLLRLDDRLVLVEGFFEAVAQRQRDVRIVDVEIVQIVPEEMRRAARLRRHELGVAVLPRARHLNAFLRALACRREHGVEQEDAGNQHAADVAAVDLVGLV